MQRSDTPRPFDGQPAATNGDSSGRAERPSRVAGSAGAATSRPGRPGAPHSSSTPATLLAASIPPALAYGARLSPPDASRYLAAVWAIRRTASTLAKLRCLGGGPAFQKAGRDVVYQRATLDAWANEMLREAGDG